MNHLIILGVLVDQTQTYIHDMLVWIDLKHYKYFRKLDTLNAQDLMDSVNKKWK